MTDKEKIKELLEVVAAIECDCLYSVGHSETSCSYVKAQQLLKRIKND